VNDGRIMVSHVTTLVVEQAPAGAIVRASGVTPNQGWWDAELIDDGSGPDDQGVLTLRFVVAEPRTQTSVSTPRSRTVTAAITLDSFALDGVRSIVVRGESNQRSVRR
jgi:hypothetical protein